MRIIQQKDSFESNICKYL